MSANDPLQFENIDDETTADALFQKFIDGCGEARYFAVLLDDGTMLHAAAAYRPYQALFLAYRLRRMAREIEAEFDTGGVSPEILQP